MGATSIWNVSDTDFPGNGTPQDKLRYAARYATSAARLWQTCDISVSDRFAELSGRADATLEALDPDGRQAMISCGASLEYLKLALRYHGCLGRVDLFPDLDRPWLAARIHFGYSGGSDSQDKQLFASMMSPAMDSKVSQASAVPDAMLEVLGRAATRERAWLEFARSESSQRRLLDLASARQLLHVEEVRDQTDTFMRSTGGEPRSRDWINPLSPRRFFRWGRPLLAVRVSARSATSTDPGGKSGPAEPIGTCSVLKTKTDDRRGWLGAGQTMARLVLQARSLGLACSCWTDVLQKPELRREFRTTIGHKGFAQAILCFWATPLAVFAQPNADMSVMATSKPLGTR